MSIAIIANPTAGRGKASKTMNNIENLLKETNTKFELIQTKKPGHAIELSNQLSRKHEVIAALGGDGTIREVLQGMWGSNACLGVIPSGTGNDYARGLGLPLEPHRALEVILSNHSEKMDVGLENGNVFGVLASIGFPVSVMKFVNNNKNRFLRGPFAIFAGVYQTIANLETFRVKITLDKTVLDRDICAVLIMNQPFGGGGLKFAPRACFNDGMFSVVIVKNLSKLQLLYTLPKVYLGKHVNHPAIEIVNTKTISIESEFLPTMFDGDLKGNTPLNAKISPSAIKVIIDKNNYSE